MMEEIMLEAFHLFLAMMALAGIVCMACVIAVILIWTYKGIKEVWRER